MTKQLHPPRFIEMTGQRFGRWLVIECAGKNPKNERVWLCRCDCGTEKVLVGTTLRLGRSLSCGCYQRELQSQKQSGLRYGRAQGLSRHRIYRIWLNMLDRCSNPDCRQYPNYGGRGIKVCPRWQESVWAFYEDVGEPPSPKHSLDRIDNDGNYEPGNCRWATPTEQHRNYRQNVTLTFGGETLTVVAWAERLKIRPGALYQRISAGWLTERILTTPVRSQSRPSQ